MPDALHGIDFASRLVSNIYGLHREQKDKETAQAEKSRQTMLSILESVANSGAVNPEDMPTLYSKLFELSGAKSKEVQEVGQHLEGLFTHPSVARKTTNIGPNVKTPETTFPAETTGPFAGVAPPPAPAFESPGVPQVGSVNTPAVRIMGPDERAQYATQAKVKEQQALMPGRIQEQTAIYGLKTAAQSAKLSQQQQDKLEQIDRTYGMKARQKYDQLAAPYRAQGFSEDEIAQAVGPMIISEFQAGVDVKTSQVGVNKQRVLDMQGRLLDAQFKTKLLKQKTDAYVERMKTLNSQPAAGTSKSSVSKANIATFTAYTKELYPAYTALKRELVKLKTDPDVDREDPDVKANISYIESQISDVEAKLKSARDTWLPKQPLPEGMDTSSGSGDGKKHYTMAQIQSTIGPDGKTKNGKTLQQVLDELKKHPGVIIDQ